MSVEFVSADQVAHAAACEAPLRLVDTFGRVARDLRVSLTDRCNLRCSYCMPPEGLDWLPTEETLTDAEVVRLVRIGVERLGIRQVRFTGGEPLLRRGLEGIIAECSQLRTDEGQTPDLALTTNALGLAKRAQGLRDAGLDRVNISLDSLDREHYAAITRRDRLDDVLEGIEAAARAGLSPIKVNTLVLRGMNEADLPDLVDYCLDRGIELRVIEQMPIGPVDTWDRQNILTADEILPRSTRVLTLIGLRPARGGLNALQDVAQAITPRNRRVMLTVQRVQGDIDAVQTRSPQSLGALSQAQRIRRQRQVRSLPFVGPKLGTLRDNPFEASAQQRFAARESNLRIR